MDASGADIASPLGDEGTGLEARAAAHDHPSLKVCLRLLSCSTEIENEIRRRLHRQFGMTPARFDYLAHLHRHPEGLRMRALSDCLMVTRSNVTTLTDELERHGLVEREPTVADRRSFNLRLTSKGRDAFERMADDHEAWILDLFSGFNTADRKVLNEVLGRLRLHIASRLSPRDGI
jgi:DNA-binding MarR family transcriptional regulator